MLRPSAKCGRLGLFGISFSISDVHEFGINNTRKAINSTYIHVLSFASTYTVSIALLVLLIPNTLATRAILPT